MSEVETLSDKELDLILFVERFHSTQGVAPTKQQIEARFDVTRDELKAFEQNSLVQRSFQVRGIVYPAPEDRFTPEQMHAAAVMTDLLDRRSDGKKLADLGISSRQWSEWVQDDQFAQYLTARSEKMLANSTYELHRGMMKGVRNGNIAAVKLGYEVTGRYRPNEETQIDVRRILFSMIEVIQKYIKDPIVLHRISQDLSNVASSETYADGIASRIAAPSFVQGSVVPTQPSIAPPKPLSLEEEQN